MVTQSQSLTKAHKEGPAAIFTAQRGHNEKKLVQGPSSPNAWDDAMWDGVKGSTCSGCKARDTAGVSQSNPPEKTCHILGAHIAVPIGSNEMRPDEALRRG